MELYDVLREREGVLVLISRVEGSAPRGEGTWMFVDKDGEQLSSIGGGNMEFMAYNRAIEMINRGVQAREVDDVILGVDMGQCCGGRVEIIWQPFYLGDLEGVRGVELELFLEDYVRRLNEEIFSGERSFRLDLREKRLATVHIIGAGHVGNEIKLRSEGLPLDCVQWDNRRENRGRARIFERVHEIDLEYGSFVLVMTYSHELDYEVCVHLLSEGRASYVGLIGSKTKGLRFLSRLRGEGKFSEDDLSRWHCPIGLGDYKGKDLGVSEVALSVLADILRRIRK